MSAFIESRPVSHSGATSLKIWDMPPGVGSELAVDFPSSPHGLGIKSYFLCGDMTGILFLAIKPTNKQKAPLTEGCPSCLIVVKDKG